MRPALLQTLVPVLLLGGGPDAAPAAASGPGFGRPLTVTLPGAGAVGTPAPAVDARGDTAIATAARLGAATGVVVRRGTIARPLGRVDILTRDGFGPVVARSGAGTAVSWQSGHSGPRRLRVRVALGTGRFAPMQELAAVRANLGYGQVLALGARRFVALWWQGVPGTARHEIRYAVSGSTGRFGHARVLAADTGPLTGVSAAAGPDGSVVAAWGTPVSVGSLRNQQLQSAVLAPDGTTFTLAPEIDAAGAAQGGEIAGIGAAGGPGGAALGWTEEGALPELLRVGTPGGRPQTAFTLTDSDDLGQRYAEGPALALPAAGGPVAAWSVVDSTGGESDRTTAGRVFAAAGSGGAYGTPQALSAPGEIARRPKAAASETVAAVGWVSRSAHGQAVHAAVRPAGAFFGTEVTHTRNAVGDPAMSGARPGVLLAWVDRRGTRGPGTLRLSVLGE